MRVKAWWAVVGVGLVGCGGVEPEAEAEMAPRDATVQAQACAPGVAVKVKDVIAPGTPLPPPWRPSPYGLSELQGTLYFATEVVGGQASLWKSDGTTAGTVVVKEFPAQGTTGDRELGGFTAVGSQLFFSINDTVLGRELWVTDGTEAGTRPVVDLTPGAEGTQFSSFAQLGGALSFFRGVPLAPSGTRLESWRSDGTAAGTVRVVDFGTQATLQASTVIAGGVQLFFLQDAVNGTRLWRTDGTAVGTSAIKALDAGEPQVSDLRGTTGGIVFALRDAGNTEIWKSDGTAAGTVRLETFGHVSSLLGVLGSHVYVSYGTTDDRLRLARVSLSGGGKATVTTLPNPFAGQPGAQPYLQIATPVGSKLYLSVAIGSPGPAPRRVDLWVTDGTAAGTLQLNQGLSTSDENWSTLFNTGSGTLLFTSAGPNDGQEPWVTDGTVANTGRVADIGPDGGSSPQSFRRVGDRIFFVANGGPPGNALWSMPAHVTCPALAPEAG
ncbi:hypothetical protein D7X74_04935 [Corallococcus sp. CA047B]|uniref:hypothetical protein n=1 Tax=Corallococcus sp. CA047B TaxID=2316729 RepID=UPI000EA21A78|nr:hypothetical protein [Corallococcus sp. CA047B]RKH20146.1 hypothetical protein D7X74_04935 [Corallococcus sp. CA047B]